MFLYAKQCNSEPAVLDQLLEQNTKVKTVPRNDISSLLKNYYIVVCVASYMGCTLSSYLKVSVITVCLNCRYLIEKTIKSIISQSYPNIQYIIVDGGSTDGTLDVINRYISHIDVVISEKDDGLYHAMNKGIKYATGDVIYFLNSGDYLYDTNVIDRVCAQFSRFPDCDILYGDVILVDDKSSKHLSMYRPTPFHVLTRCGVCHQSLFAKRSLLDSFKTFNTKYSVYADYEWLLRSIFLEKSRVHYFNTPVVYYRMGGISQNNPSEYYYERVEIINIYISYLNIKDLLIQSPSEFIYFIIIYIYLCVNFFR